MVSPLLWPWRSISTAELMDMKRGSLASNRILCVTLEVTICTLGVRPQKSYKSCVPANSPVTSLGVWRTLSMNVISPWESMPEYRLTPRFSARRSNTISGTEPTPSCTQALFGTSSNTVSAIFRSRSVWCGGV